MAAKKNTVTVPPGKVVYVDEVSYGPGEQVAVSAALAKVIAGDSATKTSATVRRPKKG